MANAMAEYRKFCEYGPCGRPFTAHRRTTKYCRPACGQAARRLVWHRQTHPVPICRSAVEWRNLYFDTRDELARMRARLRTLEEWVKEHQGVVALLTVKCEKAF